MKRRITSIIMALSLSIGLISWFSFTCLANVRLNDDGTVTIESLDNSNGCGDTSTGTVYPLASSAPTLIKRPLDSGITINTSLSDQHGSFSSQGGFLFYSNNPESVKESDLADNGYWLNRANPVGRGQIYVWHNNATGKTIESELYVLNPSKSTDIIVKTNQYGLTNGVGVNDVAAWDSFLESNQPNISVLVKPGQSVELFKQTVAPNHNFGIVAAVNITDIKGHPAEAVFQDLAIYKENLATGYAPLDGTTNGSRGEGSSYQNNLAFDPVTIDDHHYFTYKISASNDSLHGTDLVKITDYGNSKETLLEGSYGVLMTVSLPIINSYKDMQNFGIFIGSSGGYSFPFVRLRENSFISSPVEPFRGYDMIQTGKMAEGSIQLVSFTLVIPSLSSTPLVIGVHPIT